MNERTTALTRLKRIAAFIAIVWGVAGSFVLFDLIAMSGTDRLAGVSDRLTSLGVPAEVRESVTCSAPPGDATSVRVSKPSVQAAAWSLGVQVGARARWTEMLSDAVQSQNDP